jgi:hypothetical protein
MSTSLHPTTRHWLNCKIAFYEELFARQAAGEKLFDEFKRNWTRRRLGRDMKPLFVDTPTKVDVQYDDDYWARWYAKRRTK